ncbi:hypothetical protein RCH16_000292 [Cryobacterium sp. MP_M5]|nr:MULTISPECIES: hypothetical protein [unclassified Cryobacterium]MBG6057106.1 hypothetical protein [Cryobacterium sp. MP_M3]MEC5175305.1 hypothetical protein [Cryobacterium sp. MP_M5]
MTQTAQRQLAPDANLGAAFGAGFQPAGFQPAGLRPARLRPARAA